MSRAFNFFPGHLLKSELIRGASVLISGTVIAQVISVILQPLLRRLFSPEAFGVYSVYLSIVGILMVVSTLRYDDAIVLPRSDKESVNILGLALFFNVLITLLLLAVIILFGPELINFLNLPTGFSLSLLYLIPLSVFLFSAYQSLNLWLIRRKKYFSVTVNKLIRRISEGAAQITLALTGTTNALIFSDIISQAANVTTVSIQTRRNGLNLKLISFAKLRYVLRKYSEFPKYNLLPSLMSTCSYLLPPIIINKFFNPENAGFFDLSKLVLSIPLAFIASSLTSVLLQKTSEKFNRKESFLNEIKPVLFMVGLISVTEIIVISFFGEALFSYVFGNKWSASGEISRILVWSFALSFIVSSFSSIFIALRRIKMYSIWQAGYFFAIVSLGFFRHLQFNNFLKLYVLIEVLCYIAAAILMLRIIYSYESSIKSEPGK